MNKYALRRSPLAITIGSVLAGGSVQAATITVTSNLDGPVGSVAGCSLREAVASANAGNSQGGCPAGSLAPDTIVFDPSLAGSTITLTEGEMEIASSVTINGPVPQNSSGVIIDGDNLSRIFRAEGPSDINPVNVALNQLTLTRGRASGLTPFGGAVYGYYANIHMEHALVTANSTSASVAGMGVQAATAGGGLAVFQGNATLIDTTVSGNSTSANASGQNARSLALGSGLLVVTGGATIVNSTISGNDAESEITGQDASGTAGGALFVGYGVLTMVDSTVSGNSVGSWALDLHAQAIGYGGGVLVRNAEAVISGSTISGNAIAADYAALGGGVLILRSGASLSNSTISGNSVTGDLVGGSGAFVSGGPEPAHLEFIHSSVIFNAPAGIYAIPNGQTTLTLINSLVVQEEAGETACSGGAPKYVDSLATDVSCTYAATDLADISIGGLADNGGPTQTHALLPGSVAVDSAGDCDALEVTLDQRGQPRPGTGTPACDIGAFELQPAGGGDEIFSDRFEQ